VTDHLANDDEHALQIVRDIIANINKPKLHGLEVFPVEKPKYSSEEISGIISSDPKKPFEVREVIARIVDSSRFHEFKPLFGETLVTGFARIHGYPVGILANNGILFSESSLKGAHFIELCNQRAIPIVFLQNITGFMVGKQYEHGGIAKDGAKLVTAVATASVPKFTVVIGGSYGAGNYGMCGRAYQPRFLWMWPNSKISVMGGEQAANVLLTVKLDQLKSKGSSMTEKEMEDFKKPILSKYSEEGSAMYSTARIWDDGIIMPENTREILAMGISLSLNDPGWNGGSSVKRDNPGYGVFRF